MPPEDDSPVCVYRAGEMAAAAYLRHLLEEAGIPTLELEAGFDGFPRAYFGTQAFRILVSREDAEQRGEEIAAIIRQFEQTMGVGPHREKTPEPPE